MRARGAGAVLTLALALVVPGEAAAQSLRFVGPAEPRDVSLPLFSNNERRGSITVVIRNVSGVTGVLQLRFFPDRGHPVLLVGGDGSRAKLAHAKPARRVVFRRNQYRGIQVSFALPKGQRLSRVNGMLVAQLRARGPGKSQKFPEAAQLRIRATSPVARFSPSPVTLKVREACWLVADFFSDCGEKGHVLIRGEDVRALRREGGRVGHVVLSNGEGGEVSLELTDVKGDGDALTGTVKVKDTSGVGEYEGTLPLAPGVVGGPELPISVNVGHSLGLAVLVVFLGAFVGGFLALMRGIRRQRSLLRLQVKSMLERYDKQRRKSHGVTAGYDIDALYVQPRYEGDGVVRPFPADHGVSGLLWRIDSAQSDQDFDVAAARTDSFIDAVDWWIRLEPWAREIRLQIDARRVPQRKGGKKFIDCRAFHETYEVREELLTPPKNEEKVQDLQQQAARHCERLNRWRELWHLLLEVDKVRDQLDEGQRTVVADAEVDAIEKETTPNPKAKNEIAERRRAAVLEERLLDEAEDTLRYVLASIEQKLDTRVEEQLADDSRRVEQLADSVRTTSVARRLADPERSLRLPTGRDGREKRSGLWRWFKRLQRGDVFWTLLSGLVAATAYALTIWDDTWGTVVDYVTAFTAGFLTETVVKWAVLPGFQSYRARRRDVAEAKESKGVVREFEAALKRALGTSEST
jgi:hypothetical protein